MSSEIEFRDILYGAVSVPDWLGPFLRIPEFVRLRNVRLSNVDSYQFKDFNGPSRWEHGIAVAALADRCAKRKRLSERQRVTLILAALLHDIATPPFAHTAEYVLDNFDHELETQRVLSATTSPSFSPDMPVFASQLPQFRKECRSLVQRIGLRADPDEIADEVARMVTGDGEFGYLISGVLDLDNADNVTRACMYLGIRVDPAVPRRLADWLADQPGLATSLESSQEPAVHQWLEYRGALYDAFYKSSHEEIGRQAFLQHLMRRALRAGLPRRALAWNTDAGLLTTISLLREPELNSRETSLAELVQRYQLLEAATPVAEILVDDAEWLRSLRLPHAATWIEQELAGSGFEPFVIVSVRRTSGHPEVDPSEGMFPPQGVLSVFALSEEIKRNQLPSWLRDAVPAHTIGKALKRAVRDEIERRLPNWLHTREWLTFTPARQEDVLENLRSVGDWNFRLTRNENLHSYPGTFVHPIPATLLACLGLRGELVIDPFGGLGQTASEVVKHGGTAVSADSNTVANLVAGAKLTYLPIENRRSLRELSAGDLLSSEPITRPELSSIERWHHPATLDELCRIKSFIEAQENLVGRQFLTACFSAILPETTARRGKQHGYFADNTPLPAEMELPPYQNAAELFLSRLTRSIDIVERFYSLLEKAGKDPEEELRRVSVRHVNVRNAVPGDYGLAPHTAAGIITSPPYLCMADYTLGQRLSYGWLFPEQLQTDYQCEFGARRARFNQSKAFAEYLDGMRAFARTAAALLRKDGFLATVLGEPSAKAFAGQDVLGQVEAVFEEEGFERLWQTERRIQWHRNHGYQRLREEQIAVRVLKSLPNGSAAG